LKSTTTEQGGGEGQSIWFSYDSGSTWATNTFPIVGSNSNGTSITASTSNGGANAIAPCPVGRYSSGSSKTCDVCPSGYTTAHPGSTSSNDCYMCPAGRYSISQSSSTMTLLLLEAQTCVDCSTGTYNPSAGSVAGSCIGCQPGKFANSSGLSVCTDCEPGKYSLTLNATFDSCLSCPENTYFDRTGGIYPSDCIDCPEGTTNPNYAAGMSKSKSNIDV